MKNIGTRENCSEKIELLQRSFYHSGHYGSQDNFAKLDKKLHNKRVLVGPSPRSPIGIYSVVMAIDQIDFSSSSIIDFKVLVGDNCLLEMCTALPIEGIVWPFLTHRYLMLLHKYKG